MKYPDRIAIVKCVSADVEGNAALRKEIEKRHGRLDTVIANAGTCLIFDIRSQNYKLRLTVKIEGIYDSANDVSNISVANLEEHFHVCLYSFLSMMHFALTSIMTPLIGECNRYHCLVPSSRRPSQDECRAALCCYQHPCRLL